MEYCKTLVECGVQNCNMGETLSVFLQKTNYTLPKRIKYKLTHFFSALKLLPTRVSIITKCSNLQSSTSGIKAPHNQTNSIAIFISSQNTRPEASRECHLQYQVLRGSAPPPQGGRGSQNVPPRAPWWEMFVAVYRTWNHVWLFDLKE